MRKISKYLSNAILAGVVYAQDIPIVAPTGWGALEKVTIPNLISTIIKALLIVAAIIAFVFLVFGGIKWITSGGDKEGTQAAQKTITAALVGLIIVFAAWAIIQLLNTFFSIDILGALNVPKIPGLE